MFTPWIGDDVKPNGPPSALLTAKNAGLKQVFLVSNNFLSFIEAWKNAQKIGLQLIFGLELLVCKNSTEKSPESTLDESKVIIWVKNGAGYKQAIKIYSEVYKNKDNKYYHMRSSWPHLKKHWTEDLSLMICFFDGFLHKNILNQGSQIIPDFPCDPYFQLEVGSGLPFAGFIEEAIKNYGVKEDQIIKTKTLYYENKKDFKAWQILRTINQQTDFHKPELQFCNSNQFCWEHYLKLTS